VNSNTEALKGLEGATFIGLTWTSDALTLMTDRGTFVGRAEADCCASAWFESVESPTVASLFPITITRLDVGQDTGAGEEVEDNVDGYNTWLETAFGTIYLSTGRITYELRCQSNGFYRGYVVWSKVA
jgi:hypothetical protein